MTEHEDTRVLKIVFDGQIGHRNTCLKTLAEKSRKAANILQKIGADAHTAILEQERYNEIELGEVEAVIREARKALEAVRQADVTIGNIENLSRGRMKFFGQPVLPKGASNVTQLPSRPEPKAAGRASTTGSQQRADNPGRERQRQRKQSSND